MPERPAPLFKEKWCWSHGRQGDIPPGGQENESLRLSRAQEEAVRKWEWWSQLLKMSEPLEAVQFFFEKRVSA